MSSDRDLETKGIKAVLIIETLGKPPEHLVETLNDIINSIDKEKGVNVTSKKVNSPVPVKEKEGFFTSFAEVEVEVQEIINLAILMFKYMPAHVEIVQPELIALTNNGWTDIFSELTRRLHGYDEIARILQLQNSQMQKKLKDLGVEVKTKKEEKK